MRLVTDPTFCPEVARFVMIVEAQISEARLWYALIRAPKTIFAIPVVPGNMRAYSTRAGVWPFAACSVPGDGDPGCEAKFPSSCSVTSESARMTSLISLRQFGRR